MYTCLRLFLIVLLVVFVIAYNTPKVPIPSKKSLYFHYTDQQSLEQIIKTGYIKQSTDTARDAVFGSGVYLTKLNPTKTSKEMIAQNNYSSVIGNRKLSEGKVDNSIGLYLKDDAVRDVSDGSRNIYLFRGNLVLERVQWIAI